MRWSLKLQEFDMKVEYIKGESNASDGLSRYTQEIYKEVKSIGKACEINSEDRAKIIREYHLASGHRSANSLKFLIQKKYIWKEIFKQIEEFVSKCELCQANGAEKQNTKNRVIQTNNIGDLWECDLIGRIEDTNKNSKFVQVIMDHFSK
ncbi:hypothetical protein ENBRE01_1732 [Enteropsectra breve]|nr:hypothetical protein ENBRE01_1732 [Enteropsectra breve]